MTCSQAPCSLPLPPSPRRGQDPCCVFTSPRSNSPERKLSEMRPQAWLPFRVATAAGLGLSPDRRGLGRRGHPRGEDTEHGLRVHGRDRGTGRRVAHLQDTVISTLVAGMLPAKESNSLSDVMSSACSIAHRARPSAPN